jgi:hypothetical protein
MKKMTAEVILSLMIAPFAIWVFSFIFSTYKTEAEVQNVKGDIQEIKSDIRYIRNYLLEKK